MAGIFLASSLLACLVMATLSQPVDTKANQTEADQSGEEETITRGESRSKKKQLLVTATVRQMAKTDQPHT